MARSHEHLARVLQYDSVGRPGLLEVIYPDEEVQPKPGEVFLSFRPGRPDQWVSNPRNRMPTAG